MPIKRVVYLPFVVSDNKIKNDDLIDLLGDVLRVSLAYDGEGDAGSSIEPSIARDTTVFSRLSADSFPGEEFAKRSVAVFFSSSRDSRNNRVLRLSLNR